MLGCCTTATGGSAPTWAAGDAEVRRALAAVDTEPTFVTAGHDVDTGVYEDVTEREVPSVMPPRSKKKKDLAPPVMPPRSKKKKNKNKKKNAEQRGTLAPAPVPPSDTEGCCRFEIAAFTHALAATQTPRRKRTR